MELEEGSGNTAGFDRGPGCVYIRKLGLGAYRLCAHGM